MKKFNFVLISIFTILLSGLLGACSFKEAKATFTQPSLMFNPVDQLDQSSGKFDLTNFLRVENVSKKDIDFLLSNSTVFSLDGDMLSAKPGMSGRGVVYATYHKNTLSSMQIVARKKFPKPENVKWDVEQNLVTWNAVSAFFEDDQTPTTADKFMVTGERVVPVEDGEDQVFALEPKQCAEEKYEIPTENGKMLSGIYHLKVKALEKDVFADSDYAEATIYVDFMPALSKSDFHFDDGQLSWDWDVSTSATFDVKLEGQVVGSTEVPAFDLSPFLEEKAAGQYKVGIVVKDNSSNDPKKFSKASEEFFVTKLQVPQVEYVFDEKGGQIKLSSTDQADQFELTLTNEDENAAESDKVKTFSQSNNEDNAVLTVLDGLKAGIYSLSVKEKKQSTADQFFFHSSAQGTEQDFGQKVLKLDKADLFGAGGNVAGESTFHALAKSSAPKIHTKFLISHVAEPEDGFEAQSEPQEVEKTFSFEVLETGKQEFCIVQIPNSQLNEVGGENVCALNSDAGQSLEIVKLPQIEGQLSHEYQGQVEEGQEKSVLTFKKIALDPEKHVTYKLKLKNLDNVFEFVDEEKVEEVNEAGDEVSFVLSGAIERIFEPSSEGYVFAIEAILEEEPESSIGSLTEFLPLEMLSAPTKGQNSFSSELPYVWQQSGDVAPAKYRLEIFNVTSEVFEQFHENLLEFDPLENEGATKQETVFETAPSHKFEEGYYYVRIFAISAQKDILSSHEFLEDMFAMTKALSFGDVGFGFDEALRVQGNYSGYFVQIETADENVDSFDIVIDGTTTNYEKSKSIEGKTYALEENFDEAKKYELKIVAHGKFQEKTDDAIYVVAQKTLDVVKLSPVEFADLEFDERTSAFDVQNGVGTSEVKIESLQDATIVPELQDGFTRISFADKTDFSLKFVRVSASEKELKNFQIFDVDGKETVYLSSNSSQMHFKRLDAPTALQFESGILSFSHENQISRTEKYVLELVFHTKSGDVSMTLTLNQESVNSATIKTQNSNTYRLDLQPDDKGALFQPQGNKIDINIANLFKAFDENVQELKNIYDATTSVDFRAWAYLCSNQVEEGLVEISSLDSTKLNVGKMAKTNLTFVKGEPNHHVLSWDPIEAESAGVAQTEYVVFQKQVGVNGEKVITSNQFSGTQFSLEGADFETTTGVMFSYYVVATNPKFLDASKSNIIAIYKNKKVSSENVEESICLNADGTLSFDKPSASFCKGVEIKHNGEKIEDEEIDGKVTIKGEGKYAFQLLGKDFETIDDVTTYFLDSDVAEWEIKTLQSIASEGVTVEFSGNLISWQNPFTQTGVPGLEFALFFQDSAKDSAQKTFVYYTSAEETQKMEEAQKWQVDLLENTTLRNGLADFAEGNVQVQVSAHIKKMNFAKGQTIFYAPSTELLNGQTEFNHHILEDLATITKLKTPQIKKVEFVGFDTSRDTEDEWGLAKNPTIKVTFGGDNYGDEADFAVFLNDQTIAVQDLEFQKAGEGEYYFELLPVVYANQVQNGQTLKIKIYALKGGTGEVVGCLPSAPKTLEIVRASEISSVQFVADETGKGFSRLLEIVIDPKTKNQFVGNVVLRVDYATKDAEAQVKFKSVGATVEDGKLVLGEDANKFLADILDTTLVEGGTIKISVYADNYAADNTYILSCTTACESEEYVVLEHVLSENISRVGEGFEITGVNNNQETVYVLEYEDDGLKRQYIENKDGRFVFVAPADWAVGNFDIYAVQDTTEGQKFLRSKTEKITFSLDRLDRVGALTLKRDETTKALSLEWGKVENASGYLVQVFERTQDTTERNLLCETRVENAGEGTISCAISTIFGQNYENLDFDRALGCQIYIEITALGDASHNNSVVSERKNAIILPNTLDAQNGDIYVQNGLAVVKMESGKKYLYRFVSANSGEVLTEWKEVPANGLLDTFSFGENLSSIQNSRFDIEIFAMAEPTTSQSADFAFDSKTYSTQNDDTFTFEKLADIANVSYSLDSEEILFEFSSNALLTRHVFAGVEEDALQKSLESAKQVVLIEIPQNEETGEFSIPLNEILLEFDNNGIDYSSISNIYLWAVEESEGTTKYVASQPYENFKIGIVTDFVVKEVKRLKDVKPAAESEAVQYVEGWTNTYLTFENTDGNGLSTLGINLRVTHHNTGKNFTIFLENNEENNELFDASFGKDVFAINLNKIFDAGVLDDETKEINLCDLHGEFDIAVMKVCLKNGIYSVSNWVTTWKERQLNFQRLQKVWGIELRAGNLYWMSMEDVVDQYFVYFFDVGEDGEPSASYAVVGTKDKNGNPTANPWLEASKFALERHSYYLAVQSVALDNGEDGDDDLFVLASKISFKTDAFSGEEKKTVIYKNQMNVEKSPLTLKENGALSIKWQKDEDPDNLITVLLSREASETPLDEIANQLATKVFTSPFTFTLENLLNEKVTLQFRFTPIGGVVEKVRTFNVDSFVLLEDLVTFCDENGTELLELLGLLLDGPYDPNEKEIIQQFVTKINGKKPGIGTAEVFLDDFFDSLQAGKYEVEYCLLGNDVDTLSSKWYKFEKSKGENFVAISEAPKVNIIKTPASSAETNLENTFKVVFEKSEILTAAGESVFAENYYLRLNSNPDTISFEISKAGSKHQLKLVGDSQDRSIDVFDAFADGTPDSSGDAKYLAFFLNMNEKEGGSLLSEFKDAIPQDNREQKFEICAVGNDTSVSSKSNIFRVTFLAFTSFDINRGVFEWTSPGPEVETKIVVKQQTSATLFPEKVGGGRTTSTFALLDEKYGAGQYEFVKFVLVGNSQLSNVVYVDSEIYVVHNLYKLSAPNLTNDLGYIGISMTDDNYSHIKNSFSTSNPYEFQIENDASYNGIISSSTIRDTRADAERGETSYNELLYAPGVTGYVEEDDANLYQYKATEKDANRFDVKILGTSAPLKPKDNKDDYYVKDVYAYDAYADKLFDDAGVHIVLQSNNTEIQARMMESVKSLNLQDGILVWEEVTGRDGDLPESGATVIYRVDVERYTVAQDGTANFVPKQDDLKPIYTTATHFDLSTLDKDKYDEVEGLRFKITVRALALKEGDSTGKTATLEDGTTAGGNAKFGSGKYVLMSEGFVKEDVVRLEAIVDDSIQVKDRKITWQFTTKDANLTEDNFKQFLDFLVVDKTDDEEKIVLGTFDVSLDEDNGATKTFAITFDEDNLQSGERTLCVFTNKANSNNAEVIRSFGVSGTVTKLKQITADDFSIQTDFVKQIETLSFATYFEENSANTVTATTADGTEIEFSQNQTDLVILRSEEDIALAGGQNYLVIGENAAVEITFVASAGDGILSSDKSETFNFSRSSWAEGSSINWDPTKAEFSWQALDDSAEYVVEAIFTPKGSTSKETRRIFHSKSNVFKPTIIGQVKLNVRFKLGQNALQSNSLSHIVGTGVQVDESGAEYVTFALFSSGSGTKDDPYVIGDTADGGLTKEEQFKNLAYRQTKEEDYLAEFVEIGDLGSSTKTEEAKYYFVLRGDLTFDDITGIMFSGDFSGEIDGGGNTITYTSSIVINLKNQIVVSAEDNVAEVEPSSREITFQRGSALFENLTSTAKISNLKLSATFGTQKTEVGFSSIMAALAISNSGQISNVTLTNFSSHFVSQSARKVMVYAGLVGRNIGTQAIIDGCKVETSIKIDDEGIEQFIFVSGISYINYAEIKNCTSGQTGETKNQSISIYCTGEASFVQVAGIAITNTSGGRMSECTNNLDINVEGPTNNDITCYVSGIVVLGKGLSNTDTLHNNGTFYTINIEDVIKTDDGIIATTMSN